jgi:hypothetical protein
MDFIDHSNEICPAVPLTDESPEVAETQLRDTDLRAVAIGGAEPGVPEPF